VIRNFITHLRFSFDSPSYTKAEILSVFAKLRKATVILLMPVCPSVLGSHQTDFGEILYLVILRKSFEKIQASLTSDENNEHFA